MVNVEVVQAANLINSESDGDFERDAMAGAALDINFQGLQTTFKFLSH